MSFSAERFRMHLAAAGYEVRRTPLLEQSDLYSTKGGDRVISRLLTLNHHGVEYALRPEFTASAVRSYASSPSTVVRWQFSGPVFSDFFDQPERPFQRESIGAELIGFDGPAADSEVIGLAASGLNTQGISNYSVVIGHAGLSRALVERFTTDPELVQFLLDQCDTLRLAGGEGVALRRVDEYLSGRVFADDDTETGFESVGLVGSDTVIAGRRRRDIAARLAEKRRRATSASAVQDAVGFLFEWVHVRAAAPTVLARIYQLGEDSAVVAGIAADLRTTLDLLEAYGIPSDAIVLQPQLNRIWEYYSGIVFEFQADGGGSFGGGGRYDGLVRLLSGKAAPAVGFQMSVDAIAPRSEQSPSAISGVTVVGPRAASPSIVWWACALRASGITAVIDEYPVEPDSSRIGPTVVIDPGSDDAEYNGEHFDRTDVEKLSAQIRERMPHD